MAKDDRSNVDEFNDVPGEELLAEDVFAAEMGASGTSSPDGAAAAEAETVPETETAPVEATAGEPFADQTFRVKKGDAGPPVFLEAVLVAGIPLILLGIAVFGGMDFVAAIYAICLGLIPYGLWKSRKTNTVFTFLLGCALVAILTAVYCLWVEISREYHGEIKAHGAKSRASVSRPINRCDELPRPEFLSC